MPKRRRGENLLGKDLDIYIPIKFDIETTRTELKKVLGKLSTEFDLNFNLKNVEAQIKNIAKTNSEVVNKDFNNELYIKLWKAQEKTIERTRKAEQEQQKWIKKANLEREKALQYEQKTEIALEKQQQKREENISKLKEQAEIIKQNTLSDLDVFKHQYKGHYNVDEVKKFENAIRGLKVENGKLNVSEKQLNSQFKQLKNNARIVRGEIDSSKTALSSFSNELKVAISRTFTWATAMTAFYGTLRQVKNGIGFLTTLDKSLTEISIVTGKTREQTRNLALEYNSLAKTMGKTTKPFTDASVKYYRQGKQQNEVLEMTKATTIGASIANLELAQTAEYLTSTMNGMHISFNRSMDVVDKFSKVGASAGTSFEELAEAMSKTASAADVSGVSIDKLISYIGTVSEVTRESAKSIGNSFKTIFARFSKLNELGALIDEEGNTIPINKVDSALQDIGVSLKNAEGQIRSLSDVLDDVGVKWDGLDRNTKAYLATVLAGVRQQNRLIALFNNYSRSLELANVSLNSQGAALKQYDAYLQSTEAKINKFIATLEGFWLKLISGDSINSIIDFGTSLVEILDRVVNKIGLLTTATIALTSVVAIFKAKQLTGLIASLGETALAFAACAKGESIFTVATVGASLATEGLITSLTLLAANPVVQVLVGITAIVGGMVALINHTEKLREETEKINKAQTAFNETLKEYNDTLDENKVKTLANQLRELKSATNYEENIKKIKELKEELKDMMPDNPNYDVITIKLSNLENKIKTVTIAEEKYNKAKETAEALDYKSYQNTIRKIASKVKEIDSEKRLVEQYEQSVKQGKEDLELKKKLINKYPEYLSYLDDNKEMIDLNTGALKDNLSMQENLAKVEIVSAQTSMRASYEKTQQIYNDTKARIDMLEQERKAIEAANPAKLFEDLGIDNVYTNSMNKGMSKKLTNNETILTQQKKNMMVLGETLGIQKEFINTSPDDLLKAYSQSLFPINKKSDSPSSASDYQSKLDKFFNTIQLITQAESDLKEIQDQINMSTETNRIPLIQKEIDMQNKLIELNKDLLSQQIEARQELAKKFDKYGFIDISEDLETLNINMDEYNKLSTKAKKGQKSQREIVDELVNSFNNLNGSIDSTEDSIRGANKAIYDLNSSFEEQTEKLADKVVDTYKEMYKLQKESKLKSLDKEMDAEERRHKKVLDNYKEELDEYEEVINKKLKLLDRQNDKEDFNRELNKLQSERDDIKNQISTLSLDDSVEARAKIFDLNKELADKEEEIEKIQSDRTRQLRKDNLQDELDTYRKEIEEKQNAENKKFEKTKNRLELEREYITEYYDNMINDERKYAAIREEIIKGHLSSVLSDFDDFSNGVYGKLSYVGESIRNNILDRIREVKAELNSVSSYSGSSRSSSSSGNVHADYINKNVSGGMNAYNNDLDRRLSEAQKNNDYSTMLNIVNEKKRIGVLHDGGTVGGTSFNPQTEEIVKLLKGEEVFNEHQLLNIPNIFGDIIRKIIPKQLTPAGATGNNTYNLTCRFDNFRGTKKDGENVFKTIENGLRRMGKK